tara:strand:- start:248 stop:448 length:201 start_codon:yes stop_codon:yes gene_type:complete
MSNFWWDHLNKMRRLRMTKQCALKDLIELMRIEEKIRKAHESSTLRKISKYSEVKNRELIRKSLAE